MLILIQDKGIKRMKKVVIVFLMVSSLLLGTNLVNATHNDTKKDRTKTKMVTCTEQVDQIMTLIGTPSFDMSGETKVVVRFSLNEHNLVEVTEVVTENAALQKYVIQKMNGKRIRGNEVEVKDQSLTILFVAEQNEVYTVY